MHLWMHAGKRVRGERVKARSSRPPQTLEGAETQGSIQRSRRPNQASGRQGFSRGSKPRNRGLPGRPIAPAMEATAGKTVSGFIEPETARYLARGVSSEG